MLTYNFRILGQLMKNLQLNFKALNQKKYYLQNMNVIQKFKKYNFFKWLKKSRNIRKITLHLTFSIHNLSFFLCVKGSHKNYFVRE